MSLKKNSLGINKDPKDRPSKETPALAKANIGIIPKATYGDIACSNFNNNEFERLL